MFRVPGSSYLQPRALIHVISGLNWQTPEMLMGLFFVLVVVLVLVIEKIELVKLVAKRIEDEDEDKDDDDIPVR